MRILGIHHVAVIASDYAASKRFYAETLGFAVVRETFREARASYKLDLAVGDGTMIELFSFPDPPKRLSYPEACGLRHLALATDDLAGTRAELEAKGVRAEEIRRDATTGRRFFFCADPDGLPIEFYESA